MRWFWLLVVSSLAVFLASLTVVDFSSIPDAGTASVLAVALFAVPSIVAFLRWAGWKRGFLALTVVGAAATTVEGVSVLTGFPYGRFSYSEALGPMLFGLVPFALPLSYLPLLLGAFSVARSLFGRRRLHIVVFSAALLVAFDLALDPGAVAAGLWMWDDPGSYYGVPASNYLGWAMTGLAYSAAMLVLLGERIKSRSVPAGISASTLLTLSFWAGYLLKIGHLLPGVTGTLMVSIVCAVEWKEANGKGRTRSSEIRLRPV